MEGINLKSFTRSLVLIFLIFIAINTLIYHYLFGIESFLSLGVITYPEDQLPTSTVQSYNGQILLGEEADLEDTFTRSTTNDWDREWGSFSIVPFENSRVWSSYGSAETYRTGSETWENFTVQMNIYVDDFQSDGTLNFKIRRPAFTTCGHYTLTFGETHMELARQSADFLTIEQFLYEEFSFETNTWHTLVIQVDDNVLRWQLDDGLIYQLDNMLYHQGGLGIVSHQMGAMFMDDVLITFP